MSDELKIYIKALWFLTIFPSFVITSYSQTRAIEGYWKLHTKRSISGPDYENSLPLFIRINKHVDTLVITSYSTDTDDNTVSIVEAITTNSIKPFRTVTPSKRRKEVYFSEKVPNRSWNKRTIFTDLEGGNILTQIAESWRQDSGQLTIVKVFNDMEDTALNYTCEAQYERISAEDFDGEVIFGNGVLFDNTSSWKALLARAKRENKLIFVDCYATWCTPCKKMDKYVFSNNKVGKATNEHYISTKLQMDTAKNDNSAIKRRYAIANEFKKRYAIKELPTYLIFSSSGELVNKAIGGLSKQDFMTFIEESMDSSKQIYYLVKKWKSGKLSPKEIRNTALVLKSRLKDELTAFAIAYDYIINYLYKLDEASFLTKENIQFSVSFSNLLNTRSRIYKFCLLSGKRVDSAVGIEGYSNSVMQMFVYRETAKPALDAAKMRRLEPNWDSIFSKAVDLCNEPIANQVVLNAKVTYYREMKKWTLYTNYLNERTEKFPIQEDNWFALNSVAYELFKYSYDKEALRNALEWSNQSIESCNDKGAKPILLDTKANILYKLGDIDEAVALMQEVVRSIPHYREKLEKMQKGLPTWRNLDRQ